jgi:hypothetical protein
MKRIVTGMAIMGVLLAIWGAAGLAQDKPLKKVVFAVTTKDISVGHSAHSSLPQALGYWKEEGLDVMVTSVEGSAAGMQQLAAGNLQIVSLGPEEIVIGREKGVKIKGFYVQARETAAEARRPQGQDHRGARARLGLGAVREGAGGLRRHRSRQGREDPGRRRRRAGAVGAPAEDGRLPGPLGHAPGFHRE